VVNSVSAAVPAPAHQMLGEMKCSFSQFYRGCQSDAHCLPRGNQIHAPCQRLWDRSLLLYLQQSIQTRQHAYISRVQGPRKLLTTTPLSYMHPTIVVPVLVALGKGTPRACRAALRL
jgi:hypothetical protein